MPELRRFHAIADRSRRRPVSLLASALLLISLSAASAGAAPFSTGDILVGLGSSADGASEGKVRHFSPAGDLFETLFTTSGSFEQTGMCVDAALSVYTTNFEASTMSRFDAAGLLVEPVFGPAFNQHPNACILDGYGSLYVGLSDRDGRWGNGGVVKLDPAGQELAAFAPVPDQRGADWVDLAADQCTLFYTSVGAAIKRFDVCTGVQLPDFCTACADGAGGTTAGPFFALRILADGGVLVADWNGSAANGVVRRYDSTGAQLMAYAGVDAYGAFFPWALGLDPDESSFWAADNITGEIFRFDLATGAVLGQFVGGDCDDFFLPCAVTGLGIVGEPTAATRPGDVSVAKTAVASPVQAGDPAAYSIAVTANGPGSSLDVVLTDTVPAGLDWTVGGPDAALCTPSSSVPGGTAITCRFGVMLKATTRTVTLTAATAPAQCPGISNTATVTALRDRNPASNTAGPVTIAVTCPDVSVTNSTSAPTIDAGETATYSVTVTNHGPGAARAVALSDDLPAGLAWTVAGTDAAACSAGSPVAGGSTLTCALGSLGEGASRTITLSAPTTTASCGTLANTARVSADVDTDAANNTSGPATVTVKCPVLVPDVAVSVSTSTPSIAAGGTARYDVLVTSNGPGIARTVVLTDTLPPGLAWTVVGVDGSACSPGSAVPGGTTLNCTFPTLAAGESRAITLTAATTTANCGNIDDTATVSAAGDKDPSNDSSGPVRIAVTCQPAAVTLACPATALVGSSLSLSGSITPAPAISPLALTYTSPSGHVVSHASQTATGGSYADALVPNELGPWTVQAHWAGDAGHTAADSPVCPFVVYDTPADGSFVIGDGDTATGAAVAFWGAQWWKENTLSRGTTPGTASFKGFADAVQLPESCGGTWVSRPGNSSKPPSSIPSYMAVIVSSTVAKNGSSLSGDVVEELIVKTDGGYGPNPGHAGTGTVVAVRCRR